MPGDQLMDRLANPLAALRDDQRGVSVTIDHALGLMILLVLTGIFMTSVSGTYDGREQAVTEQELERINEEIAAGLVDADSLAQTGEFRANGTNDSQEVTATTRMSLPSSVAGEGYTVSVSEGSGGDIVVASQSGGVTVETTVRTEADLAEAAAGTGDVVITYENGELNVEVI